MKNVNDKFQFPELITTLLYASAVCSMMSLCINKEVISISLVINTVIITFLVFADWHNRILTPLSFPNADQIAKQQPLMQFFKLSFEVIGMYFLVVFFSLFIKGQNNISLKDVNKYNAFAGYLLTCFIWNYLAFKIMKGLSSKALISGIIKGNVFDIPGLNDYTGTFNKKIQDAEGELEKQFSNDRISKSFNDTISKAHRKLKRQRISVDLARFCAQLIANHLIWINAFVSSFIIFSLYIGKPDDTLFEILLSNLKFDNFLIDSSLLKFILVLSVLLLLYTSFISIRTHKTFSGISILIILLLFYCNFTADMIIYIMIFQQIFVGILIQIVTQNGHSSQQPVESIITLNKD